MRILVLGAGATGGYFGGRLAAAGRDVTILVRPARARQLEADGLAIHSPAGDVRTPVATVTRERLSAAYDVVLLTCKSYDLDEAIDTIAPAMLGHAALLPLLNGMRHLDVLDSAFGQARVMGGLAKITATLKDGEIHHLKPLHTLIFGARRPEQAAIAAAIAADWRGAGFDAEASADIILEMWEKWVLIAALAGSTCLMRSALCDILAAKGGEALIVAMIDEAQEIAEASGKPLRPAAIAFIKGLLTDKASTMMASMLRDLEDGRRTEADHILGDLLDRGERAGVAAPTIALARLHLDAATYRRARQS